MPIVAIKLTDDEAARLDEVAKREKRARKYQASITLMERVDEILSSDPADVEAFIQSRKETVR